MRRLAVLVAALAMVLAACGATQPDVVATIDGVEITRELFESMHPDPGELDAEERASTLLLVLIHEAFINTADAELGITIDESSAAAAFADRTVSADAVGGLDQLLANRGETVERVQFEAELDVLRATVGPRLVLEEADGFDIVAAYEEYLKEFGRVCVNQITLNETVGLVEIIERINSGEPFADVAREHSVDSLAQRPDGESGAGGDMGCSFPNSFGFGLAEAVLDESVPVGEAFGPVISDRGLHVLQIYERELPALEGVRDEVVESAVVAQSDAVFNAWAVGVLQRAAVTVHEDWGTWGPREGTNGIPTVIPVDQG